jgi:Lon protease-like protein
VATEDVLPLFPLASVLFPAAPLPLRIFEPRYRQLLDDLTAAGVPARFGVVTLVSGGEVLTAPINTAEFVNVGTVAEVMDVQRAPDGSGNLLAAGSARFRIVRMLETETPYLQAQVEYLDEPLGVLKPELLRQVTSAARQHAVALTRLTGRRRDDPYPDDPVLLSYRIAVDLPLPRDDAVSLLVQPSAAERLASLRRLLRRELTLLRRTRTVAVPPAAVQIAAAVN